MKETIFDFLVNYIACWYVGAITLLLMGVELWYALPLIIALIPAQIMTKQQQIERQIDELNQQIRDENNKIQRKERYKQPPNTVEERALEFVVSKGYGKEKTDSDRISTGHLVNMLIEFKGATDNSELREAAEKVR